MVVQRGGPFPSAPLVFCVNLRIVMRTEFIIAGDQLNAVLPSRLLPWGDKSANHC